MSPFNGRPCAYCRKGMINPTKYQKICTDCRRKKNKQKTKMMRERWERIRKRRIRLKNKHKKIYNAQT